MNFTVFSKKDFLLEKKILKKKRNYQKIKLKKKNYKRWEAVDYTFFISYKT